MNVCSHCKSKLPALAESCPGCGLPCEPSPITAPAPGIAQAPFGQPYFGQQPPALDRQPYFGQQPAALGQQPYFGQQPAQPAGEAQGAPPADNPQGSTTQSLPTDIQGYLTLPPIEESPNNGASPNGYPSASFGDIRFDHNAPQVGTPQAPSSPAPQFYRPAMPQQQFFGQGPTLGQGPTFGQGPFPPQPGQFYRPAPSQPPPLPTADRQSSLLNFLSFLLPLVGLILFFMQKNENPRRARSILFWTCLGLGFALVFWFCGLVILAIIYSDPQTYTTWDNYASAAQALPWLRGFCS